jgi:hypothetical protein
LVSRKTGCTQPRLGKKAVLGCGKASFLRIKAKPARGVFPSSNVVKRIGVIIISAALSFGLSPSLLGSGFGKAGHLAGNKRSSQERAIQRPVTETCSHTIEPELPGTRSTRTRSALWSKSVARLSSAVGSLHRIGCLPLIRVGTQEHAVPEWRWRRGRYESRKQRAFSRALTSLALPKWPKRVVYHTTSGMAATASHSGGDSMGRILADGLLQASEMHVAVEVCKRQRIFEFELPTALGIVPLTARKAGCPSRSAVLTRPRRG